MDKKNPMIERIYSSKKIKTPKIKMNLKKIKPKINFKNKNTKKIFKVSMILCIALFTVDHFVHIIEPIIEKKSIYMARSIATKVSNEETSRVMENYKYEDLVNVIMDENKNIKMITANTININKITSEIPLYIQESLKEIDKSEFNIKLGTVMGSKLFFEKGPNIKIRMSNNGGIETNLFSEFKEAGVNQTLHRIYLEIKCDVVIITPFNSVEEQIVNQVLLAEGVIVGNTPETYYNFNGMNESNLLDTIQ